MASPDLNTLNGVPVDLPVNATKSTATVLTTLASLYTSVAAIYAATTRIQIILTLLFTPILLLIVRSVRNYYLPHLRNVPGPKAAKVSRAWKAWISAKGDAQVTLLDAHRKYGPIVRTGPRSVSICEPEDVALVFGKGKEGKEWIKSDYYAGFSLLLDGVIRDNLFSARSPKLHRELRSVIAPKYQLSALLPLEPLFDSCLTILSDQLEKRSSAPVDFGQWLHWFAFDGIGQVTFMSRFGFMETASDVSNIIAGSWDWMKYASTIGQVPEYHKYLLGSIRLSSWLDKMSGANPIPIVVNLIQSCVAKYDAEIQAHGKTQRGDLLEYLREKTDAQGEKLPDTEVVHHLLANLLAGADTTATGLRAVFYFLVKHPDVLAKLQGELDAARAAGRISETITYAQGTNLPYLMAVIKEALRLHPVIGFPLERIVPAGGAVVAGRFLPAGTIVGVNTWVLHRHSVFGAQPDVFLPERWLSASPAQLRAMEANWLVFGKGSRECVGKYIALMDLVKCVGQVCRGWELEWVGAEVRDKEGKVVGRREEWSVGCHQFARQDGVVLKVTRREGKA